MKKTSRSAKRVGHLRPVARTQVGVSTWCPAEVIGTLRRLGFKIKLPQKIPGIYLGAGRGCEFWSMEASDMHRVMFQAGVFDITIEAWLRLSNREGGFPSWHSSTNLGGFYLPVWNGDIILIGDRKKAGPIMELIELYKKE